MRNLIGIYKTEEERETLVGHAPIELSLLLFYFLQNNTENMLHVFVTGKRYREIDLVIPGCYRALTKSKQTAKILQEQLEKKKKNSTTFGLSFEFKDYLKLFPVTV